MTRETIVLQFPQPHTSHVVISKMIDCLIIGYGNPDGGIIHVEHREYLFFKDAPDFLNIHDGHGWNLDKLALLLPALEYRREAQP